MTIVSYMNKYFCEIGQRLSEKHVQKTHARLRLPRMNLNTIFQKPTH